MADINHAATPPTSGPIEGDGINYGGLVRFGLILVATVVICQALMYGMLKYMDAAAGRQDEARAPLAAPSGQLPPAPNLLTNEPLNLKTFRDREDAVLSSYGWVDKNAGFVRIPIDRAKALLLERGIPGGSPMPAGVPAGTAGATGATGATGPTGKVIK